MYISILQNMNIDTRTLMINKKQAGMKNLLYILFVVGLITSCVQGEPEINRRQQRQIQKMLEYKVDSLRKEQEKVCYSAVLKAAIPKADSIITQFEYEAMNEELETPEKPEKPEKPEVQIPKFE